MQKAHQIQLFVDNYVGVLDQVCILVRRSGWNIKGMHVCEEPARSGTRIILSMEGKADFRLLLGQLERLDCVRELNHSDHAKDGSRELALARCPKGALAGLADSHGARLLQSGPDGDVYELSGDEESVDRFLAECASVSGVKVMRSGAIHL